MGWNTGGLHFEGRRFYSREGQELADSRPPGIPHQRGFLFLGMTGSGRKCSFSRGLY